MPEVIGQLASPAALCFCAASCSKYGVCLSSISTTAVNTAPSIALQISSALPAIVNVNQYSTYAACASGVSPTSAAPCELGATATDAQDGTFGDSIYLHSCLALLSFHLHVRQRSGAWHSDACGWCPPNAAPVPSCISGSFPCRGAFPSANVRSSLAKTAHILPLSMVARGIGHVPCKCPIGCIASVRVSHCGP